MSNFTRTVKTQVIFLKISCVRCTFVKFHIHSLGFPPPLLRGGGHPDPEIGQS